MSQAPGGHRAAAELRATELGAALLEALDQPVIACDTAGRVVTLNFAARRLCAVSEGAVIGEECLRLREEDGRDLAVERTPLALALAGEATVAKRLALLTDTGELHTVQVSARELRGPGGKTLGAAMTICRIEDESSDERRLRNYASDIEILTEVSRLLSELHDPDDAAGIVCMVATGATGAIAVLLWGAADGSLELQCHEGAFEPATVPLLAEATHEGAVRALAQATTIVERHENMAPGDVPCALAWHEPLISGGHPTGVLTIVWPSVLEDLERPRSLIGLLGHHAATALERADLLRRLREAARTDALTGVANRRVWQESLDRELTRVRRTKQPLSLVLIDVDHFKAYNDRYCHPEGDRLLRDTAKAWEAQLRVADLLARMGGEEFAVMLPDCDLEGALAVAERLRTSMPHGQTCSLGLVTSDGHETASELYSTADAALYRAKQGGRDRIEVGRPGERPWLAADALEPV